MKTIKLVPCALPAEEVARLKGLGFLRNKTTPDCFNCRVITVNGKVKSDNIRTVCDAADKFGSGEVTLTSRMTLEVQNIPYENVEPFLAFLNERGLETGGTGAKVRPVVSCKGSTCQFGNIDTFSLSEKIHERFYKGYRDVALPHKFKIAVGGCPNNCVKPDINDLGIVGQRVPSDDPDNRSGAKIYLGGRWGKKSAKGIPLSKVFTDEEEILDTIERVILFYKENGLPKERFADTIARIGFDTVEKAVLKDE
ncbi:MAG: (4Fe-4S)-binding protein [Acutalibacteraceae bacterium]